MHTPKPVNPTDLLLYKRIPAPTAEMLAHLERVVNQTSKIAKDYSKYSEADVREEVVVDLVRFLGYSKGDTFGVDRELSFAVGDKTKKYPDYALNVLGVEHHWILEAKKPSEKPESFKSKVINQALGYAAHPDANAALIALCDGRRFTLYDREISLETPVLDFELKNINDHALDLLAWLGPWQTFYFEKRRAIRGIERALKGEVTSGRVDDFRQAANRAIDAGQRKVWENRRKFTGNSKKENLREAFKDIPTSSLIKTYFYDPVINTVFYEVAQKAIEDSRVASQGICLAALPENLPLLTPNFLPNLLRTFLMMKAENCPHPFFPSWLGGSSDWNEGITSIIDCCLTRFENDPGRQTSLNYFTGMHRLTRALHISLPLTSHSSHLRYRLNQFDSNELSSLAVMDSPTRQSILEVDHIAKMVTLQLIRENRDKHGATKIETLKQSLSEIWAIEGAMVEKKGYSALVKEADRGEIYPIPIIGRRYDWQLEHSLCVISEYPEQIEYAQTKHTKIIEEAARMGSSAARKLIGVEQSSKLRDLPSEWYAKRFFNDDVRAYEKLNAAYARGES